MSFIFVITLAEEDALTKEDLQRWHPTGSKVELRLGRSWFSKRGRYLSVGTRRYGSAGLLSDNADPDKEYWDFEPDLLPDLATLLKTLREHTKSCFILEACWINEGASQHTPISIDELTRMIEEGRISTKANYLVC